MSEAPNDHGSSMRAYGGPCAGGFWELKDRLIGGPAGVCSICKRTPEMHPTDEPHKQLVARLEAYFKDWAPRCRTNDPEYGAGDWQWLAQHLVAIATASLSAELSDELRARRDAAIAALVPTSMEADAVRFRGLPRWIAAIIWKPSPADLPTLGHLKNGFELVDLRAWCDEALEKGGPNEGG